MLDKYIYIYLKTQFRFWSDRSIKKRKDTDKLPIGKEQLTYKKTDNLTHCQTKKQANRQSYTPIERQKDEEQTEKTERMSAI